MLRKSAKNGLKNSLKLALLLLGLTSLTACSTISYYGQSIAGHNRLMWARQSVDKLIETAEPELKAQLQLAKELRQFAVDELALPDNKSYSSYVDLKRDYPVWTVVAADEFSLNPRSWCYPVIGCASYRGYFSKDDALEYAEQLQSQGLETHVGGAIAYSTLGWFSDPLLPSMMRYGEADFAENMFHELAHQVLYVNGNSAFNEAFASVVGEQGALRWLQRHNPDMVSAYLKRLQLTDDFIQLLNETKTELAELYARDVSEKQKRTEKTNIIGQIQDNYLRLKDTQWDGEGDFDRWFETPVNNARLAAISTYRDEMPRLQNLLNQCNGDLGRFFTLLTKVSKDYKSDVLLQNLPTDCELAD